MFGSGAAKRGSTRFGALAAGALPRQQADTRLALPPPSRPVSAKKVDAVTVARKTAQVIDIVEQTTPVRPKPVAHKKAAVQKKPQLTVKKTAAPKPIKNKPAKKADGAAGNLSFDEMLAIATEDVVGSSQKKKTAVAANPTKKAAVTIKTHLAKPVQKLKAVSPPKPKKAATVVKTHLAKPVQKIKVVAAPKKVTAIVPVAKPHSKALVVKSDEDRAIGEAAARIAADMMKGSTKALPDTSASKALVTVSKRKSAPKQNKTKKAAPSSSSTQQPSFDSLLASIVKDDDKLTVAAKKKTNNKSSSAKTPAQPQATKYLSKQSDIDAAAARIAAEFLKDSSSSKKAPSTLTKTTVAVVKPVRPDAQSPKKAPAQSKTAKKKAQPKRSPVARVNAETRRLLAKQAAEAKAAALEAKRLKAAELKEKAEAKRLAKETAARIREEKRAAAAEKREKIKLAQRAAREKAREIQRQRAAIKREKALIAAARRRERRLAMLARAREKRQAKLAREKARKQRMREKMLDKLRIARETAKAERLIEQEINAHQKAIARTKAVEKLAEEKSHGGVVPVSTHSESDIDKLIASAVYDESAKIWKIADIKQKKNDKAFEEVYKKASDYASQIERKMINDGKLADELFAKAWTVHRQEEKEARRNEILAGEVFDAASDLHARREKQRMEDTRAANELFRKALTIKEADIATTADAHRANALRNFVIQQMKKNRQISVPQLVKKLREIGFPLAPA